MKNVPQVTLPLGVLKESIGAASSATEAQQEMQRAKAATMKADRAAVTVSDRPRVSILSFFLLEAEGIFSAQS